MIYLRFAVLSKIHKFIETSYLFFWNVKRCISKQFFLLSFVAVVLLFCPVKVVKGERLSFKTYTTADGLASDDVIKIVTDSRGFLWFCTVEGLSRFDGYKFKNYTQEQGLPHRTIFDLLETAEGDYLAATSNGLTVFDPNGTSFRWNILEDKLEQNLNEAPLFKTYFISGQGTKKPPKSIFSLVQDGNGNIFAGTARAVYKVTKTESEWMFQKVYFEEWETDTIEINQLFTDSRKDIWVAANNAIYWMSKTGDIKKVIDSGGNNIFEDRDGKIWIDSGGNNIGSRVFEVTKDGSDAVLKKTYSTKDGLAQNIFTNAVAQTEDGRIFVASATRLYQFLPDAPVTAAKFKLLDNRAIKAAIDRSGNIWFTTQGKGVAKYSPQSFITYDERDGIPDEFIRSLFSNKDGEVFLTIGDQKLIRHNSRGKIETIVPLGLEKRFWTHNLLDLQSRDGEWWIPSAQGLRRYPKVADFGDLAKTPPKKVYTTADGLFSNEVPAIFEDSRGDIWISNTASDNNLVRFERATEKIYQYTTADGLPEKNAPITFGEDARGNIWIGYYSGDLCRFKDGRFRQFTAADGISKGFVSGMLSDSKGRFWLASDSRGLYRVDNPNDDAPNFVNVSTADGLSSNRTMCLTEDDLGRIYIGTGRGINRLELESGRVKIFTQADGLPGNIVSQCHKSSDGKLWFSSNNSLIQLNSQADAPTKPPPILIDSLIVNGKARSVSELGETGIKNLEFDSDEKQIQIGFFAISLDTGEALRYQYKLEGQDWSQPDEQRTVSFNLAVGTYNFQVRAINSDGIVSENPAVVSFKINPPFWQRWWFLVLSAIFVCSILFSIYQYRTKNLRRINAALTEANRLEENLRKSREERIAEIQRVRTRIATDLHDDIGSSLSQISLYSELARQRERERGKAGDSLDMITNVANELVDTMSDIVWAINPKKDHLQDLTQRMRRFAADVLTAKEIDLEFTVPETDHEISLGANIRREVFLIFKETVNNIAKHSGSTEAKIAFSMRNNKLVISFEDNGKGFDQTEKAGENGASDWKKFRGGNGILNMRKRSSELGGEYEIKSDSGKGTIVILSVPLELKEEN